MKKFLENIDDGDLKGPFETMNQNQKKYLDTI